MEMKLTHINKRDQWSTKMLSHCFVKSLNLIWHSATNKIYLPVSERDVIFKHLTMI